MGFRSASQVVGQAEPGPILGGAATDGSRCTRGRRGNGGFGGGEASDDFQLRTILRFVVGAFFVKGIRV